MSSEAETDDDVCSQTVSECVRVTLLNYFNELDGHDAADLYELVLTQVEKPMLEVVMQQTRGNITKASQVLGLNRATLRKKLKKYSLEK